MNKIFFTLGIWFLFPYSLWSQDTIGKSALIDAYFDKGYEQLFINKDSAYHYFNAASGLAVELKDYNAQLSILSYTIYTSDYHYDLKKYGQSLEKVRAILEADSLQSQIEDYEIYFNLFLSDQGIYHFETKNYESAILIFQKAAF